MRHAPVTIDDLPETLPLFPLAGALLLPHGRLPLNIFEPRYIAMIDDALASSRMIAMIQPIHAEGETPTSSDLYDVGCAGRITSFSETGDGRYLITLTGVCRFRLSEERTAITPYRQGGMDWNPYADDLSLENEDIDDREHLLAVLKKYLSVQSMDADWESIEDAPPVVLINSLAMICPFSSTEKQALLEAQSLADRAEILTTLMEISTAASADISDTSLQ